MVGTYRLYRRNVFLLTALAAAAAVVLAGCSSSREITSSPPSAEAVLAALGGSPSDGGPGAGRSQGVTRKNSDRGVTIGVTWENPQDTSSALTFSVVMDTHSGDLDGYDLGKLTVLRNDRGQEVRPQQSDVPPGGHHRSGFLIFAPRDGSGKSLAGAGTKAVEMVIRDVAGVKERILRWEVSAQ